MQRAADFLRNPAIRKKLIIFGIAKKLAYAGFFAFSLITTPAEAKDYTIDYANSKIEFSGTHADTPFKGSFGEWTATVSFDPNDLAGSRITATFKTASAKTGDPMYDGTLPLTDWLNIKAYPEASFVSKTITAREDGGYTAEGDLTIRGITHPVKMDFTLSDINTAPVKAEGKATIDRLDFDIGRKSDATAEWVSREMTVTITLTATPQ